MQRIPPTGCQDDMFGFNYRGSTSVSASGLKCFPWNSVNELVFRLTVYPDSYAQIGAINGLMTGEYNIDLFY